MSVHQTAPALNLAPPTRWRFAKTHLTSLRLRLLPYAQRAQMRWNSLAPRDRKQLILMIGVLIAAAIWFLLTKPALNTLSYWKDELPRLRSQSLALQEILTTPGSTKAAPGHPAQPPVKLAASSLDQAGLAGTYRISETGTTINIAFAQPVEASRLVTWLLDQTSMPGLSVQQVTLERIDQGPPVAPGVQVRARVTLVQH